MHASTTRKTNAHVTELLAHVAPNLHATMRHGGARHTQVLDHRRALVVPGKQRTASGLVAEAVCHDDLEVLVGAIDPLHELPHKLAVCSNDVRHVGEGGCRRRIAFLSPWHVRTHT